MRYGRMVRDLSLDGSLDEGFDMDDNENDGDWEDSGEPKCIECESENLEDLDNLTVEQLKYLVALPEEQRVAVTDRMLNKTFVMPDLKMRKNSKYIGGGKVFQC